MSAPIDKPTFANMFTAIPLKNRSSSIRVVSSAKGDIVVRELQDSTATSKRFCPTII